MGETLHAIVEEFCPSRPMVGGEKTVALWSDVAEFRFGKDYGMMIMQSGISTTCGSIISSTCSALSCADGRRDRVAPRHAGAERAAIAYSVIATCHLVGVNPQDYLADVLPRLARGVVLRDVPAMAPAAWSWRVLRRPLQLERLALRQATSGCRPGVRAGE